MLTSEERAALDALGPAAALEGSRYRKVLWWTVAAAVAATISAWPVVEP